MLNNTAIYQVSGADLQDIVNSLIRETKNQLEAQIRAKNTECYSTTEEVVKRLKVDRSTLWRWNKSGYLKAVKFGGKVRYKESDLLRIMEG